MKAAIHTKYRPPEIVEMKNIPKPTSKDTEVLIREHTPTWEPGRKPET